MGTKYYLYYPQPIILLLFELRKALQVWPAGSFPALMVLN
jgi:hypothetical protein